MIRIFAINADYRKNREGINWYYAFANNKREARSRFKEHFPWLKIIYEVRDCEHEEAQNVIAHPEKYILF